MPKIYTEANLKRVFDAFREGDMRRSEVAEMLNISTEEVDSMYEAARKRFRYGAPVRVSKHKRESCLISPRDRQISVPVKREPGRYSNRSSLGIASPGTQGHFGI